MFDAFKPRKQCKKKTYNGPAITVGAGENAYSIFTAANAHGKIAVVGGGHTVGPGGFTQGGGHWLLSGKYGVAADRIVQISLVTADGKAVTASECENQ